jgi:hypothetical protein
MTTMNELNEAQGSGEAKPAKRLAHTYHFTNFSEVQRLVCPMAPDPTVLSFTNRLQLEMRGGVY